MALETGVTYIDDLVATNPPNTDTLDEADDHIRNIKTAVQGSFPNLGAAAVTKTAAQLNSAPVNDITSGTLQATTSGTTIDFTSIPTWIKKITISFNGVSTNGTVNPFIQIGDSGGIEATGYESGAKTVTSDTVIATSSIITTHFLLQATTGASLRMYGHATLTLMDSTTNLWCFSSVLFNAAAASGQQSTGCGIKALSATLDRVRLSAGGTDTFDLGSINILYE